MRGLVVALLLLTASPVAAQMYIPGVPTSSEETLTVSTTAVGITANLCGAGNLGGAWIYVTNNGVYMSLHGATATPDSGDFPLNSGDWFYLRPARNARFIRQSADTDVKIQCVE